MCYIVETFQIDVAETYHLRYINIGHINVTKAYPIALSGSFPVYKLHCTVLLE